MLIKTTGKIGVREFIAMILLTIGIKLADTTPTLLFERGQQTAWMVACIDLVLITVPLIFLLLLLKRHQNKGLIEIVYVILGTPLGFVVGMVLFLIMLVGSVLNSRSYVDIISTMFFQTTPIYILYFTIMLGAWFVASRGLETVARTSLIILPYITVALIFLVVFVWDDLDSINLFPLGGPGMAELLSQGLRYSSIFGEIILLAVIFPLVRNYSSFKKGAVIGLVAGVAELVVFMLVYVMVFSYPSVNNVSYPFQNLTQLANLGVAFQQTESFFLAFWAMATIVHFAVYLFLTAAIFAYIFKQMKPEPYVLPFAGLVWLLGLIPENLSQTVFVLREPFLVFTSAFLLPLPILLWVVDHVKRKLSHA